MLKIFNTLHRQAQEFGAKNLEHVNLYTCGPTAYNYAHIGNLRSFVMADLLYRTLKLKGLNPKWVMNITDVDDKTIKGTIEKYGKDAGVSELNAFTEEYFRAFVKDLKEVNVLSDEITFVKVTDTIPQIQEFILRLLDKGYAYKAEDGSTYFSIEKYQQDFGDYGLLIGEKFLEGKKNRGSGKSR
jgi:cysteinyl-tRNA synthetase